MQYTDSLVYRSVLEQIIVKKFCSSNFSHLYGYSFVKFSETCLKLIIRFIVNYNVRLGKEITVFTKPERDTNYWRLLGRKVLARW